MKKGILVILSLILIQTSCHVVYGWTLNKETLIVGVGKSAQLSVDTKKKAAYSSDDTTIAMIDQKGIVTGKKAGRTWLHVQIGATTQDCQVIVKKVMKIKLKTSIVHENGKAHGVNLSGLQEGWIVSYRKKKTDDYQDQPITRTKVGKTHVYVRVKAEGYLTYYGESDIIIRKKGASLRLKPSLTSLSFVGDSVMLGASSQLKKVFPKCYVDAKVSRQVWHGLDVLKAMKKKGHLGTTVVIGLGTNCKPSAKQIDQIVRYLGQKRDIYWIHAYGKTLKTQKGINQAIDQAVKKYNHVHLIHWDVYAKKHPDYFYKDGIHLRPEGAKGYASYIKTCLSQPLD